MRPSKRKVTSVLVALAPLAALKVITFFLGSGGPSNAVAESVVPAAAPPPVLAPPPAIAELTGEQERALAALAVLHEQRLEGTPFLYTAVAETGTPAPVVVHRTAPVPELKLQSIMKTSGGNIALIGGRPHEVGDAVGESGGWVIKTIEARSVTIVHRATGREVTQSMQ
jgi:hypothetical protein